MALGERAVLAGVEVERVSLFGFAVARSEAWGAFGAGTTLPHLWTIEEMAALLSAVQTEADDDGEALGRTQERLKAGPDAEARIAELRRAHGKALRVTGWARAKRARWTGPEAWLVASYPKGGDGRWARARSTGRGVTISVDDRRLSGRRRQRPARGRRCSRRGERCSRRSAPFSGWRKTGPAGRRCSKSRG